MGKIVYYFAINDKEYPADLNPDDDKSGGVVILEMARDVGDSISHYFYDVFNFPQKMTFLALVYALRDKIDFSSLVQYLAFAHSTQVMTEQDIKAAFDSSVLPS